MSAAKAEVVVDTNVALVANGKTEQAEQSCVSTCTDKLRQIIEGKKYIVLLDDKCLILQEYQNKLCFSGQPGPGDAFFKWLWDNQAVESHCRVVPVTPHEDQGFEEFPGDPSLSSFDQDDRKFVAVALASGSSPWVLNASDPGWWRHREALREHGVAVVFLCPELMS